ncbi:MAG: DUF1540 domain-containing protein [Clostridia bacterium]|nr:DUF1540 domain-containing protein [Clostridia bacterium]
MNEKTNCKHTNSINCTVENCVYHSGQHTCTAKEVQVGPQSACCCQDTVCGTFKKANTK